MPRTIEERLQEIINTPGGFSLETGRLVLALIKDFRAEGIAHRTIRDSAMDAARKA